MMDTNPYKLVEHASVLIVEPSAEMRTKIAKAFNRSKIRLLAANCGKVALNLAMRLEEPALAIVELTLPDMSGLEVATRLNKILHCPIILTTNDPDPQIIAEMLDLIAEDVICKPFDNRELAARVHRLLVRQTNNFSPSDGVKVNRHQNIVYNRRFSAHSLEQ